MASNRVSYYGLTLDNTTVSIQVGYYGLILTGATALVRSVNDDGSTKTMTSNLIDQTNYHSVI